MAKINIYIDQLSTSNSCWTQTIPRVHGLGDSSIKYKVVLEIIITIVSVLPGYCTAIGKNPSVVSLVHEISKLSTLKEKTDLCNDCKKYFWIESISNLLSGSRPF